MGNSVDVSFPRRFPSPPQPRPGAHSMLRLDGIIRHENWRLRRGGNRCESMRVYSSSRLSKFSLCVSWLVLVPRTGLEPVTFGVGDRRSIQMSYRGMGPQTGLEPATYGVEAHRSIHLNYWGIW